MSRNAPTPSHPMPYIRAEFDKVFRSTGHTEMAIRSVAASTREVEVIVSTHLCYTFLVDHEQFPPSRSLAPVAQDKTAAAQFSECLEAKLVETWEAILNPAKPVQQGQLKITSERIKGGRGMLDVVIYASPQRRFKFTEHEWREWCTTAA